LLDCVIDCMFTTLCSASLVRPHFPQCLASPLAQDGDEGEKGGGKIDGGKLQAPKRALRVALSELRGFLDGSAICESGAQRF
jgi:hypothetical protein